MIKQGHPLRIAAQFKPDILQLLRDELSVTTAEEFLGLVRLHHRELEGMLQLKDHELQELIQAAALAVGPEEAQAILEPAEVAYPFRTGHDAPMVRSSQR